MVLFRCPTPPRRARGTCGYCLLPPTCRVLHSRYLQGLPVLVHGISRRAWGLRLRGTAPELALSLLGVLPSVVRTTSASRLQIFEAQYPAHLYPCLRFSGHFAVPHAKTGGRVDRCSFLVRVFHPLSHAGLSRRTEPSSRARIPLASAWPFQKLTGDYSVFVQIAICNNAVTC